MKKSKTSIKKWMTLILTGLVLLFFNSCQDLNENEMDLNLNSGEQLITWNELLDQVDLESEIAFVQNGESIQDAIDAACNVYEDYGIRVFTVGFGSSADADTLVAMANCSGGEYFNSSSVDKLIEAYEEITKKMTEFTLTQTAN